MWVYIKEIGKFFQSTDNSTHQPSLISKNSYNHSSSKITLPFTQFYTFSSDKSRCGFLQHITVELNCT
jgi:hypothetical protein